MIFYKINIISLDLHVFAAKSEMPGAKKTDLLAVWVKCKLFVAAVIYNNGPTVLSVGPLVVVAVCLGSALLSYKTFVIAPAIEAQIGVVAFALGLHQTILG